MTFGFPTLKLSIVMCPFIAYCVTQLETVFCGLIFWRFLFLLPNIIVDIFAMLKIFSSA